MEVLSSRLDCFIYVLRPRPTAEGYLANEWGLGSPAAHAYVLATGVGSVIHVGLWQTSGQADASTLKAKRHAGPPKPPFTGARAPLGLNHALLARAEVGMSGGTLTRGFESVRDSSRYFVLTVKAADGRAAPLGVGFETRDAAFALKSALYDYAVRVDRQAAGARALERRRRGEEAPSPHPLAPAPARAAVQAHTEPDATRGVHVGEFALAPSARLTLRLGSGGSGGGEGGHRAGGSKLGTPPPPPAYSRGTAPSLAAARDTEAGGLALHEGGVGAGAREEGGQAHERVGEVEDDAEFGDFEG